MHKSWLWRLGLGLAIGGSMYACQSNRSSVDTGDSVVTGPAKTGGSCAPGHQGCPCDTAGASVPCGTHAGQRGNYVTCAMGHSVCTAGQWSACSIDSLVTKSLSGSTLGAGGLRTLSETTHCPADAGLCKDDCDPNAFTIITSDAGDVDASGTVATDGGGITLTSCGLACQVALDCASGSPTTLKGTVYDPAGNNPIPGAYVYVPVDPAGNLPPLSTGAACDSCAAIGSIDAVSVVQTNADGTFVLPNVPSTDVAPKAPIPLVVQVGKWRREVMLPSVPKCQTLDVPALDTRLPRSSTDGLAGHADIPKMAIATGSQDAIQCLLLKMGVDPAEFQLPGSGGRRIDYYVGNGMDFSSPAPPKSSLLGGPSGADAGADAAGAEAGTGAGADGGVDGSIDAGTGGGGAAGSALATYDMVLLPCGGVPDPAPMQSYPLDDVYADKVSAYANAGGHLYTSHFGYTWLATPSKLDGQMRPTQANPTNPATGNANPFYGVASWDLNAQSYNSPVSATIDMALAGGQTFATWMKTIGAASASAQFTIDTAREDLTKVNAPVIEWAHNSASSNEPFDFSFDTPLGASACGRVGFVDFHSENTMNGSCNNDSDCGFGATCILGPRGTCAPVQCSRDGDPACNNYTCVGSALTGQCIEDSCNADGDCASNICNNRICDCSMDSECLSKSCRNARCVPPTPNQCALNKDCGSSEQCTGGTAGTCQKTCTTDADCMTDFHHELCVGGQCQGCTVDTDCTSRVCNGSGGPGVCSKTSNVFPGACRQGKLTPQEDALEFMLLDLTACTPPTPPTSLPVPFPQSVTFTEDFAASCPAGTRAVWRELDWDATIPPGSSIDFSAQTANDAADGGLPDYSTAQSVPVVTVTTSGGTFQAFLDTGMGSMGAFNVATPPVISRNNLRLTVTMNRTPDRMAAPTLNDWQVKADCLPAE